MRLFPRAALPIDPEVGRHAKKPGARVLHVLKQATERDQGAGERILYEVLSVPRIAGEEPAIAVQLRPNGFERLYELAPRRLDVIGARTCQTIVVDVAHVQ